MTIIEKLQRACEEANRVQARADDLAFAHRDGKDDDSDVQARARSLSLNASERSYALSQAILLQQPETEHDVLILMAHLVQQLGLIAADHSNSHTEVAHRASQSLLDWQLKRTGATLSGWALEAIRDTQFQVASRRGSHNGRNSSCTLR